MVIISDTSPLTALLLVGRGDLLTSLFDRVVIPPAVERELLCAHASLPQWLEVTAPQRIPTSILEGGLDAGETEAIALALELHPDALLMDERLGRRLAQRHGLPVTGLLGVLVLAKNTGRINAVVPLIRELQDKGTCWFGHQLLTEVCSVVGEVWA